MRVLHLSTSSSGGAGVAALRTHNSLTRLGVQSSFLSNNFVDLQPDRNIALKNKLINLTSSSVTFFQANVVQKTAELTTPISVNKLQTSKILREQFDLIHIHAFYNLLNSKSILRLSSSGFPIFLTMHDQRLFTGGCHYSGDCEKFKVGCQKCPQVNPGLGKLVENSFNKAKENLAEIKNLSLISPSRWLANFAKESTILKDRSVHVVKNPIPDIYKSSQVDKWRSERGFSDKTLLIGIVSANLDNPYKGIDLFVEVLNRIGQDLKSREIMILFIGKGKVSKLSNLVPHRVVEVQSDMEMSSILASLDGLVVPSTQDNSPNVIGEALMAGVQVIGTDVGGIPEMLKSGLGEIFRSGDSVQLENLILNMKRNCTRAQTRERAAKIYGQEIIGQEIIRLYSNSIATQ